MDKLEDGKPPKRPRTNTDPETTRMFTIEDLESAFARKKADSATGIDGITYEMVKHMNIGTKELILKRLNEQWKEGMVIEEWKKIKIIPVLKPGKEMY
jgi:hypothetical protein